jgi:hypothetical protein
VKGYLALTQESEGFPAAAKPSLYLHHHLSQWAKKIHHDCHACKIIIHYWKNFNIKLTVQCLWKL